MEIYEKEYSEEVNAQKTNVFDDLLNFGASLAKNLAQAGTQYLTKELEYSQQKEMTKFSTYLEEQKLKLQKEIMALQAEIAQGNIYAEKELMNARNELKNIENKKILYTSIAIGSIALIGTGIFFLVKNLMKKR